jgi:hypothetical protein
MHGNTGSQNKSALARYTFYTSIFLIPLFPSPSSRMSVMMTIRMLSLCLCHSSWCCPGAHVSFVATIDTHVFSPTRAHSFTLSLFHSFTLSLFHSFTLSLFHSFTLSLFHSFTLSLFHYSTIPLFHYSTLSLFHLFTFSPFRLFTLTP